DVAVEAGAKHVTAEKSARIGLFDRTLEDGLHVEELAADIDVGDLGADGVARDRASLEHEVRIPLHQQVIFERAWLAFVGVARDVLGVGRLLVDELPLHPGRKACAAAAAQARSLDDVDDLRGSERERFAQALISLVLQVEIERKGVRLADIFGENRVHISDGLSNQRQVITKTRRARSFTNSSCTNTSS